MSGVVAVEIPRSVELVVALLGVLRAGAVYVPDRPRSYAAPTTRARPFDCGRRRPGAEPTIADRPADIVTPTPAHRDSARRTYKPPRRAGHLDLAGHPGHPAYLIYTSGSTGRPKGVVVPHRALVNQLTWLHHEFPLDRRPTGCCTRSPPASTRRCWRSSGR